MNVTSILDIFLKASELGSGIWLLVFGPKGVFEVISSKRKKSTTAKQDSQSLSSADNGVAPPISKAPGTLYGVKRSTLFNVGIAVIVLVASFITLTVFFQNPAVVITSPENGSNVTVQATVQGTAYNVPGDEELWVLVVPDTRRDYYPQNGPVVITGNTWDASAVVGLPSNVGLGFTLIAALSNQEGNTAIRLYLNQPDQTADGFSSLPGGIKPMSQVHVTRI